MTTRTVRKGDVGTLIRVYVGTDITQALRKKLVYVKPNGVAGVWPGTVVDDMYITYTTGAGDIDQVGLWKLQAYVETVDGNWYGDLGTFIVQDRLIETMPTTTTTTTTTTTV